MPIRLASVLLASTVLWGACGGGSGIPTLMVTDECGYEGPTTVAEGDARLTLQRSGLGDYGAAMVLFEDGYEVSDLEAYFADVTQSWEDRPDWVVVRHLLEVNDDSVASPQGDTVVMDLQPGDYAIVCINYSDDRAEVAAQVEVGRDG